MLGDADDGAQPQPPRAQHVRGRGGVGGGGGGGDRSDRSDRSDPSDDENDEDSRPNPCPDASPPLHPPTRTRTPNGRAASGCGSSGGDDDDGDHDHDDDATSSPSVRVLDLDHVIAEIGVGRFHVRLLMCVGAFMLASSTQFALVSFLGFSVQCEEPAWLVTTSQASLLSMLIFFGMLVGTMFWGWLGDCAGRKPTMMGVAVTSLFFSVARVLAADFGGLMALQFVLGVTLSGFGVAFTFFVEFFPDDARAFWSMLLTLFWSGGVILATLVAWLAQDRGLGWRGMVWLSSLPLLVNALAMLLVPRSPRFLLSRGRNQEALRVLQAAARECGVTLAPFRLAKALSVARSPGWTASLHPRYRRTTLLLYAVWFACGFCYYGAMMMSTTIVEAREQAQSRLQRTHGDGDLVNVSDCPTDGSPAYSEADFVDSLVGSLAELPGIALAVLMVDRYGRRLTQSVAFVGFSLALFCIGVFSGTKASDAALLFLARALSNTSYSVTWIYTPEVFPTSFRTTAFAVSECFSHVGAMVTPFVAQEMLGVGLLAPACAIYGFASLGGYGATHFLQRETAGAALEEEVAWAPPSTAPSAFSTAAVAPALGGGGVPGDTEMVERR